MGVYIWNRLPSAYQEVEYIQSSGTQYIDTGYNPNNNTEVSAKFSLVSLNNSYVYGVRNDQSGSSRRAFFMGYDTSLQKFYAQVLNNTNNNQILSLSNASSNTIYTTLQNNISFYINGVLQGNYNNQSAFSVGYNMFVFGGKIGDSVGNKMPMKLYYMKISESGTLLRDFVPCYRKSDNVIGLYDIVNSVFYTNAGTGTFSKGSDVNTYRESSLKNAYIGEVFEYSYDFRNKTSAQVTADGYVTGAGTPAYNSNGFTSSNSSVARINKNIESLANAKKITLSFTVVLGSGSTGTGIRLMGANRTYGTGVLFDVNSNLCQYFIGGDKVTDSSGLSSGNHTTTVVLNLTNKTAVFSRTGKTDYSTSITDTQISNIKNNITLSEIFAGMSAGAISNWYLLVE